MKDLFFADINNTLFLRHYDHKLLLISGNRVKFYTLEEIKNVVRAQNIAIYNIKDIDKNEKIVYVSNNVKLKRQLRSCIVENTEKNSHSNGDGNCSGKYGSSNKSETNYVCIAFEQGNVWLCAEDEANKLFIYEKLIYRKVCDVIKIELFICNGAINALILYRDYTLMMYHEKLKNTIKLPTHEYAYNFCLSNNYQHFAIFNHNNLYIYDMLKRNYFVGNRENGSMSKHEDIMRKDEHLENAGVVEGAGDANSVQGNACVEVKNIFDFSKNYKNLLNCDWHPKNHCIALCGKKSVRYLTLYNYNVYEFSGAQVHETFINATQFITISENVTLLTSLSCSDYLFCVWEFELEYCLYKFKSEYLISHFDMSYFNNHLHMSLLAQEKHLANEKLLDKKILQKIESNDSEKGSTFHDATNDPTIFEQSKSEMYTSKKSNINRDTTVDKEKQNTDGYKQSGVYYTSIHQSEKDKMNGTQMNGNYKKNSDSFATDFNTNYHNARKRKKNIFMDDDEDEDSEDTGKNLSHKRFANDSGINDARNKREDKPDECYEGKKVESKMNHINDKEKNLDYTYNSDDSGKYDSLKKKLEDSIYEDNVYNPKEYNLQNFINKNRDVILNSRRGYENLEDSNNYLFDNEDDQKSVTGFNSYVKDKFDQLRELKKQVDFLHKQMMNFTKINLDDFIVLSPGLCEEPENIHDQWCMFWNDIGHITKKKEGNKTYIYIFLFRGEEIGKKKITDVYNVTSASLSAYGFALASNPYEKSHSKSNSILCFHNLRDNIIWNKYLPNDESIKGVANGNNFVAIVTSNNFLRIYSAYGYIINTFLLKGIPVAICAYEYLLFIITCPYIFENVSSYNINNMYKCTLYKVYENFTNIKTNKYNTYHITILYEDILSLPSCHYLNWVNMSNFGVPYVKDTSNYIYGLYPLFKKNNNIVYDWVPIFDMSNLNIPEQTDKNSTIKNGKRLSSNTRNRNKTKLSNSRKGDGEKEVEQQKDEEEEDEGQSGKEEQNCNDELHRDDDTESSGHCIYYPLYFDNYEQISVIKLNKNEVEPRSNKIESCLGYNVEKKYILMNECNLIKYEKYVKILQNNPNLSLDNDSNNECASLPWEQYDELRSRVDLYCKQLFVNIYYDYMNDGKNKNACDTLKSLNKSYDKWIMRMFAILKNDKKNQKLAVKTSRLFKNVKNMMLSISLVDDEYSTLHSEITNEYLKRQVKDENFKNYHQNVHYEEEYKDEDQKHKEIYEKCYKNNKNALLEEKKYCSDIKQTIELCNNSAKNNVEIKGKNENRFLDKFFTGVTKNQSVDNLFSQEKKTTQIKKKNTLENFFSELKEQ
ncbi:hypothetical protein, conserved [Plasmodium ovale curtisi]|uniref:WDHD1/CFT4 second beta-propeller domain-containing protein n=1 Tax=Plasmodium ovale curtisi TaxID=864141 RepID=A0A1A8W7H8_PLAOA|nr:hypothetical protein, conserved [Plasmodium ovale curtisi]